MRKFFWMCSIFAALIVVTLIGCEILVRIKIVNPYKFKHERLSSNSSDVSTLILGNSLTYYGLMPSELGDSSFNLAFPAQTVRYDNLLLRHYPFENLQTVIQPISYASLTDSEYENPYMWHYARKYKLYMDLDIHSDFSKYNLEISDLPQFFFALHNVFRPPVLTCDSTGFGLDLPYKKRNADMEDLGPRQAQANTAEDFRNVENRKKDLLAIVEYCKARKIRLVFVTPPAYHSYRDNYDTRQFGLMRHFIDSITNAQNIEYYDFLAHPAFTENDFFDPPHLNQSGAAKFSRLLRDTLAIRP